MDMETLQHEIRRMRLERDVRIDGTFEEEHYNLIQGKDGKWEVFFLERGHKIDLSVHETQEEAADALVALLLRYHPGCAKMKPPLWDRWWWKCRSGR